MISSHEDPRAVAIICDSESNQEVDESQKRLYDGLRCDPAIEILKLICSKAPQVLRLSLILALLLSRTKDVYVVPGGFIAFGALRPPIIHERLPMRFRGALRRSCPILKPFVYSSGKPRLKRRWLSPACFESTALDRAICCN